MGNLASSLDRTLPVPLGIQLRGLIEYGIACGELMPGTQLPSVRELADAGGVAPMTVSGVYKDLRDSGLIVTKPGAGTFVATPPADGVHDFETMQRLEVQMDRLLAEAEAAGLSPADVAGLLNARIARVRAREQRPLRLVMVGVFREATQAYAADIALKLKGPDTIEATTIDDLRAGRDGEGTDLYVTLANRRKEVEGLVGAGSPVVSVSFIPSERTRTRLAAVDPVARLGILSVFPEFLALMKPGVLRFTPHVQSVEVALVDDPDLKAFLGRLDVVVYATGAEGALDGLPDGLEAIEYRHVPDPHAIQRELLPAIERLRAGLPLKETTA
jgi:DNA-binding transcriptional regulator YhcF (GntR family)